MKSTSTFRSVLRCTLFIAVFLLISPLVRSQESGVFNLRFSVDEALIDEVKKETTSNRSVLTGYSDRVELSEDLLDSVRAGTYFLIREKLGGNVSMLIRQDGKGRDITTQGMDIFPGMPIGTIKQAMGNAAKDHYVRIDGRVIPQPGASTSVSNPRKSKIRPRVEMQVWIFDSNGQQTFTNRIVQKDFEVLRSNSRVSGRIKTTVAEVLSAERIVEIYLLCLEQALFEK